MKALENLNKMVEQGLGEITEVVESQIQEVIEFIAAYEKGAAILDNPISVNASMETRGTVYDDGGYGINCATEEGVELLNKGITYVCPHGVGCDSLWTREQFCLKCARKAEKGARRNAKRLAR